MNQEKVGKLIAKLRKEHKLTQEQLGAKLGVNSKAVSKWECGLTTPDISIVNELAEILGITTKELLEGKQKLNTNDHKKIKDKIKIFFVKNIIFIVLLFILSIFCSFLFMYFINNYNKYQLINFKSNSDKFFSEGYIAVYPNRELIILKDLVYHSVEKGTDNEIKISRLKVNIVNDEEVIFTYNFEVEYDKYGKEKYYYISELVDNFSTIIVENEKNSYLKNNKLKLIIEYKTEKEIVKEEYKLNVTIDEKSSKFKK